MLYIVLSLIAVLASLRPHSFYCLSVATIIHFENAFATHSLVALPGVIVLICLRVFVVLTILVVAAIWETFFKSSTPSNVLKLPQRSDVTSSKALMEENVTEARAKKSLIDDDPAVSEQPIQNNKEKPAPSSSGSGSNMQSVDDKEVNAAAEQSNNDVSQEASDTEPTVKVLLKEEAKQEEVAAPISEVQAGDTAAAEPHAMQVALHESTKIVPTNNEDDNTSCTKSPAASTHEDTTTPLTSVAGDSSIKSEDDNEEQQSHLLKKAEKQKVINAPPPPPPPRVSSLQPSKSREIRNRVQSAFSKMKPSKSSSTTPSAKEPTKKPSVHRRFFSLARRQKQQQQQQQQQGPSSNKHRLSNLLQK